MGVSKIFLGIALVVLVNGTCARVSSVKQELLPSDGRTVRVMIRKEFTLQPDGSYREEGSSASSDKTNPSQISDMETSYDEAESAPPLSYAYSPFPYYSETDDSDFEGSVNHPQFTSDDVKDVMRQLEQSGFTGYSNRQYRANAPTPATSYNFVPRHYNQTASASVQSSVRSAYPQYDINKSNGQSYYFEDQGTTAQQNSGYFKASPVSSSSKYRPPSSIQEILKKSEQTSQSASHDNQYYSPKDQFSYHYDNGVDGYVSQGPSNDYGGPTYGPPTTPFVPTPVSEYGAPGLGGSNHHVPSPVSDFDAPLNHQSGGWNSHDGGQGHGGGGGGQLSYILHQKGEVGNQILNQGGKVIQQAVHQKGEKAKIIGSVLSQAPGKFSHVLRTKAEIATGLFHHGSRAIGSVLNVKAQAAKQASNLIAAKGKAANAVIRAGGGTAADLIVLKGKGIANLITSSGRAASALLNHKGNKVAKIAEVLGGHSVGHGGSLSGGGGYSGGWAQEEGISGGYSENEEQYEASPSPSRVYDELQDALKNVVQSPASSYGQPPAPASSELKLTSAFRSIYDNFKSQPKQSTGSSLFGSYSSPVEVTATPEENKEQSSIGQSATTIGESLNKMSKMFNNVASVITWLSPNKNKDS